MLALFAKELRIRVWEQKDAVVEHDLASLTSRVPWQPGVADGVDIASPNALAGPRDLRMFANFGRFVAELIGVRNLGDLIAALA